MEGKGGEKEGEGGGKGGGRWRGGRRDGMNRIYRLVNLFSSL